MCSRKWKHWIFHSHFINYRSLRNMINNIFLNIHQRFKFISFIHSGVFFLLQIFTRGSFFPNRNEIFRIKKKKNREFYIRTHFVFNWNLISKHVKSYVRLRLRLLHISKARVTQTIYNNNKLHNTYILSCVDPASQLLDHYMLIRLHARVMKFVPY